MKKLLSFWMLVMCSLELLAWDADPDMHLLMSLKYISNNDVYELPVANDIVRKEINFYGTEIDPNKSSKNDRFKITVNGVEVKPTNSQTYNHLRVLRKQLNYEARSGGISELKMGSLLCRLGGPAQGVKLETLHLNIDDNHIIDTNIKPVYDQALNCLYRPRYSLKRTEGLKAAIEATAILRTIEEMHRVQK